ncbi:MAG: hypothetical protein VX877_12165, partial [Planctomycetota bacterium]|nr:hypothetical protein [Planctomycetota bacterium]
ERDDLGRDTGCEFQGGLDIGQVHGADLTLVLRENQGGLQPAQKIMVDLENRYRLGQLVFDGAVDLGTRGIDVDRGVAAGREQLDSRRVITFVRAAHQ